MKRLRKIVCMTLVWSMMLPMLAAASQSAAVMAADNTGNYDSEHNALMGVNAAGRKTVIITKDTGAEITAEDIVYINQSDDVFSESVNFMLQPGIGEGTYRVSLGGGSSAEPDIWYFTIGAVEPKNELAAEVLEIKAYDDGNGKTLYRKGFRVQQEGEGIYTRIIVYNGDTAAGAWSLTNVPAISGGGTIDYGIQIYNIPDEATAQSLRITLSE